MSGQAPLARCDEDGEATEPMLAVPAALMHAVFEELRSSGCMARHWHLEGRCGSRISRLVADGGGGEEDGPHPARLTIPILESAASAIRDMDLLSGRCPGAFQPPTAILNLLRTGDIVLRRLPVTPARLPKLEDVDGVVHPERAVGGQRASVVTAASSNPPPRDSFTFAELFAGIGGFRIGLEALGGRCVFVSEIDPKCVEAYKKNFGVEVQVLGDIWAVEDSAIPVHDVLVAGFPCQPFSTLGDQPGLEDGKAGCRGMLFTQIVRILKARRPHAFILENVPGLLSCDGGDALARILSELKEAGYRVHHELVNARCLTAQSRNRLYIVGLLGEHGPSFEFPFIPDLQLRCGDVLEDDLELEAQGVIEAYTLTDSQFRALRGNKLWQPSKLAWPDKTASTLNSHYSVGVSRAGTQLAPRPAPHNPRRFTPRECCRLMGFPEAWELGSPEPDQCFNAWFKSRYRMLGNAVCPPVVAALGGAVLGMCPGIAGFYACPDWRDAGCTAAIRLAIEALPRVRRSQLLSRLHSSFSTMDAR